MCLLRTCHIRGHPLLDVISIKRVTLDSCVPWHRHPSTYLILLFSKIFSSEKSPSYGSNYTILIDTNMNVREKKEEEITYVAFVICTSQRKKRKETRGVTSSLLYKITVTIIVIFIK